MSVAVRSLFAVAARRAAPALRVSAASCAASPVAAQVVRDAGRQVAPACFSASFSTKSKKGKKAAPAEISAEIEKEEVQFDITPTTEAMEKSIDRLQHEMASLRTGRATAGMLDHIKADVYGESLSLKSLGLTVVRDPQMLVFTAFDSGTVPVIEKAIATSPLGLNPQSEGTDILVPVPRPSKESLQAMKKVCRTEAENARVAIRHARKAAMDGVKKISSEDERFRLNKDVQKLTDSYISRVDEIEKTKEKSIDDHST